MRMDVRGVLQVCNEDGDLYKALILLVDMVYATFHIQVIKELFSFDAKTLAVVSLILFIVVTLCGTVAMVVIAVLLAPKSRFSRNYVEKIYYISMSSMVILGVIVYFIGDNLPPIVIMYNAELSCDENCVENIQTAGKSLLYVSLLSFRIFPLLLRKYHDTHTIPIDTVKELEEVRSHKTTHFISFVIHILSLMLGVEAIYSAVWGGSYTIDGTCTKSDLRGSLAGWAMSWATWTLFVTVYFILEFSRARIQIYKRVTSYVCLMSTVIVILYFQLGLYLLSDNSEPILCACNGNGTEHGCTEKDGNIIRTSFMSVALTLYLATLTIVGLIACK